MLELLIIRTGDSYLRFKPEGYQICGMSKASVFPFSQIDHVRELHRSSIENGVPHAEIRKLVIVEEPFSEEA